MSKDEIRPSLKEYVHNIARRFLISCPNFLYRPLAKRLLPSEITFLNYYRFMKRFDPDAFLKKTKKFRIITDKNNVSSMFNMCFLASKMGMLVRTLYEGYIPVFAIYNQDHVNIWEMLLKQPFDIQLDDIEQRAEKDPDMIVETVETVDGKFLPSFEIVYIPMFLRLWKKMYHIFAVPNDETRQYIDNECAELKIQDRRVLGVICRGTDFVTLRPAFHPVQPELEQVISFVEQIMKKRHLDYIYLATEEERIQKRFEEAFPGKILINKRVYYDSIYYSDANVATIGQVKFGMENERFYKSLTYFSSLSILSRCRAMIGGNCGGSLFSLLNNNRRFWYWHLFRLGYYQNKDWYKCKKKG